MWYHGWIEKGEKWPQPPLPTNSPSHDFPEKGVVHYFFLYRKQSMNLPYSNRPDKTDNPEKPEWQFRDPITPARVAHLLATKMISATDLLILWVINALVRPHGTEDGIGCYATNVFIGNAVNSYPTHVSERITFLQEKSLIMCFKMNGQRYLETAWSRTPEEIHSIPGEYGEKLRLAYDKMVEKLKGEEMWTSAQPEVRPSAQPEVRPSAQPEVIDKEEVLRVRKLKKDTPRKKSSSNQDSSDPDFIRRNGWAIRLHEVVTNILKIKKAWHRLKWVDEFRLLEKQVENVDQIEQVLSWYEENASAYKEKGIMRIQHARHFRNGFFSLEDKMNQQSGHSDQYWHSRNLQTPEERNRW